jgi:hypothetical protein
MNDTNIGIGLSATDSYSPSLTFGNSRTYKAIVDNKISETTGANVSVWGYIDETGAITARFTSSDEHVARFHGRFRGSNGAGAWSSSTDLCGGSWRAVRQ